MPDPQAASTRQSFLAAFHYRNFRYLWGSGLGIAVTNSMEILVIGWLVLELTDSPALVGLIAACRFVGMALGPFFGTLTDRFDRRRILIVTRAVARNLARTHVALQYASKIKDWHILSMVFFSD